MRSFLEALLPTRLSRSLLGLMPLPVAAAFALPSYLPLEMWQVQSLNILQTRLLLAVSVVLLCMTGSFISVVLYNKKVMQELAEIKKFMSVEQSIAFSKKFNEAGESNYS